MTAEPAPLPSVRKRRVPTRPETIRAILLMLLGFFFYGMSDMLAKVLMQHLAPLQVAWLRQLGLLGGVLVLLVLKGPAILKSRRPLLQFGRGMTVVAASTSFLFAIAYVPLADATAVSFFAPFLVTAMAALFLGEKVGIRRWMAVILGFVGTMIIVRPGMNAFHPAIFAVLIAAVAFALRQILSRLLAGSDPLVTTVAYTALTASLLLTLPLPFIWVNPTETYQFALMVAIAIAASCGELSIIRALDLGEAAVLSPLQYTLMVWSTLWGLLVFAQLPDLWTWIGTSIVVASGIYSLYRETRFRP